MNRSVHLLHLDAESVFIEPHAGNASTLRGYQAHVQKSGGQSRFRVEKHFPQVSCATLRADFRKFRAKASALPGNRVALGAASFGAIKLRATLRVSRDGLGRHAPQTANIRGELPGLPR